MKKFIFLVFLFYGCSVLSPLQKSKLISLYHLIETEKFKDAKVVCEEMIEKEESSQWASTWYAKGYLCQTAYIKGVKNNNPKWFELYPDQLYLSWGSYEKARSLDPGRRMENQLIPKYVLLINDFQKLGLRNLNERKFSQALRAFEQAILIERLAFLQLQPDTTLVYNAGLAAYRIKNWEKAKAYLGRLHQYRFSENATHLLFKTNLALRDTVAAENVLFEGIDAYENNENLVIMLAGLLADQSRTVEAVAVIDKALEKDPENSTLFYNKGLAFQMDGRYAEAIAAYESAIDLNPDNLMAYANIATCYYNIGVSFEESTLELTNNRDVKRQRQKSEAAFNRSLQWLDEAIIRNPDDIWIIERLSSLYIEMGKPDKTRTLLKNLE
jgi:tetratricopeptide (TPR) repeat protein